MIPVAIQGAKTSVKFGAISPEVQYLVTSFTNDMKNLRVRRMWSQEGSFVDRQVAGAQTQVISATLGSLRGLFKLNGVNLLNLFKSPALQIPFFWYFALDLRKIIEGSDPALAQQLVESSFFWLTDLTEPDPWYGLPIFTGALLYFNVEMAVGKKSLSGETSSQSNIAKFLKDAFQTLAIFMPCFMAQQPSGVQLYLATSMIFTLLQSNALRNDAVRQSIGLPPIHAKPRGIDDSEYLKDFMTKMAERQSAKAKGGFVLGEGVSVMGSQISVPTFGKKRKSSIVVEKSEEEERMAAAVMDESKMAKIELPAHTLPTGLLVFPDLFKSTPTPYLEGMAAPVFRDTRQRRNRGKRRSGEATGTGVEQPLSMPEIPMSVMEAANRGEKLEEPRPVEMAPREVLERRNVDKKKKSKAPIDVGKLKSKWSRKRGKPGKKGPR